MLAMSGLVRFTSPLHLDVAAVASGIRGRAQRGALGSGAGAERQVHPIVKHLVFLLLVLLLLPKVPSCLHLPRRSELLLSAASALLALSRA